MKTKILIFIFCLLSSYLSFGQIREDEQKILWDYPIKSGTEEWKQLESNKAKVDVCQIPDSILQDISTNDLMTLCLQYPLLSDGFAFNNINDGLKKLFSNFNGIRVLAKRQNAINVFLERYISEIRNIANVWHKYSDFDVWYSFECISLLELIVSYSDFHNNTSKESQKKILESLLLGYREKIKYHECFQGHGFTSNLFARAHTLIKIDSALLENFEGMNKSVLFFGRADADLINTIDSLSYNLIK